jgi:hypothetical protein
MVRRAGVLVATAILSGIAACASAPGNVPQCRGRSVPINPVPRPVVQTTPVAERERDAARK